MVTKGVAAMKKQWFALILFSVILHSAFALEFRLDGGASRWGFAAQGNAMSQIWNGKLPLTVTMKCELFNASGVKRPVMPWQSWCGILMEDQNNRYIGGILCPGNRTPTVDYGAVVYENRGNFSMKNDGKKLRLTAGTLVLRLSFDGKVLLLSAGPDTEKLEVVWKYMPPTGFLPKRIGFVLDTAQPGSVVERFALHSFIVQSNGKDTEWNLQDLSSWQKNFLTLKPVIKKEKQLWVDLSERLNKELPRRDVRIGRGTYTFGKVEMPEGSALIFERGAKVQITNASEIKILGNRCRIEGGTWSFNCQNRKKPVISGAEISDVSIRDILFSGFHQENVSQAEFDFASFDSCIDLIAENNRIAGVKDCFHFQNCRRVSVKNNGAKNCERLTSFQNGSEYLQHTGNWSDHVRFQCQWWGGDSDDTKEKVRKNTARLVSREIKPGMPGYEPNTAGVYDITVENNTAVNGMCLAWGSKGRNILIANNLARFMSDLAYDTEGGENVVISGNIAINSKCAGIGGYFYGSRLLIANNQILVLNEGNKEFQGGFLRLHSPGKNTHFGNGKVFITGNQFINEINPKALLTIEAARNVVIFGNLFSGGGIRLLAEAEDITINGNTMEMTDIQKIPLIAFSGNRHSSRILMNNLFRNTEGTALPALSSDKEHTGGTLTLSGNYFEGFQKEIILKGNGILKNLTPHSNAWETGAWKDKIK